MRERRVRPVLVLLLVGYALALIAFAAAVPSLRLAWPADRFRQVAGIGLTLAAAGALVLAVVSLRTRPLPKLAGLGVVIVLAALGFHFAPNVTSGRERLLEQTHLAQFGLLALFYALVYARRFTDAALYTTGLAFVVAVALCDELVQWWIPGRVGALEDIRLDLVAGVIGLTLAALVVLSDRIPLRLGREGGAATLRAVAIVVLLLAGFIDRVHLGHAFEEASSGVLVHSRFPEPGLLARSERWRPRPEPKGTLARLIEGEDFFASEARFHVEARNRLREARRPALAATEQAVLERYFASFLAATPEAALPPGEAARLRDAGPDGGTDRAVSGPPQIVTWVDRWALWLLAVTVAAGALAAAELLALRRFTSGPE